MSLSNNSVAVITGAASGLGRALALKLAQENIAGIAISDWNEAELAVTAEMLEKLGEIVYHGGGTEIIELVRKVRAGEKLEL